MSVPSTPERNSRSMNSLLFAASNTSTTPAGPPPSLAGTFTPSGTPSSTPFGTPSASFLGSSVMQGMGSPQGPFNLSSQISGGASVPAPKSIFNQSQKRRTPSARPGRGAKTRQPSRLSMQVAIDDDEEEAAQINQTGSITIPDSDSEDDESGNDDAEEEALMHGRDMDDGASDVTEDMWMNMADDSIGTPGFGDGSDLLMLATPAATERVRKDAQSIYRTTTVQGGSRGRAHKHAALARDFYSNQMGVADLGESPQVIQATEGHIVRLYDDGVGASDDAEKLDDTLAGVVSGVVSAWQEHLANIPPSDEEHVAQIGPSPHASDFQKAYYVANLALHIHHTRYQEDGKLKPVPLPETLFQWLSDHHNLYPNHVEEILDHRPSPASHSLFWPTVWVSLLRGRVQDSIGLLAGGYWEEATKGTRNERSFTGRALENVQRAVAETIGMLESCPGVASNWEIWGAEWTLFRVRAQGAHDRLKRFAEGKEGEDAYVSSPFCGRQSLTGMARKAESQLPWEVYENLNIIFDIVLGSQDAILEAAQDWCEASIGLFGWWDERRNYKHNSVLSRSQALVLVSSATTDPDSFLDRLASAFHVAVESDFQFNSMNPVELGMACVFEDNAEGLIGILRGWSLPVASAVAEIASLGRWLPPPQASRALGTEDLDLEDLDVLGVDPGPPEERDGIKDSTLIEYAAKLADYRERFPVQDRAGYSREGWELAIRILGRLDSPERSEELIGDLVQHLMDSLDSDSGSRVDKTWTLVNELGMVSFAEAAAETYGDVLARDSHRYGEAMWYYALAHRSHKVRDVMNLLISYSLLHSTAYPPVHDLDDRLQKLLHQRNQTLESLAKQDLEAAELLGKMLSGYASLRQFYEIRDTYLGSTATTSANAAHSYRQQAATALVSVIASSDDNIRGGLFDASRDGVVSEDFLLALLGEALVFIADPQHTNIAKAIPAITLEMIGTLLKAVEDLQAMDGTRVRLATDEFLHVVLSNMPGAVKAATPADLLRRSSGGNFGLSTNSVLLSQLNKSIGGLTARAGNDTRGWDWRELMSVGAKADDILRRMRLGLAKDLASLWLKEADMVVTL